MSLTTKETNKLEYYLNLVSRKSKRLNIIQSELQKLTSDLLEGRRVVKYLEALRDNDLQGQVEAKLNWDMLEPISFLYEGKTINGIYKGTWGAYGKSIKIDGNHYELKQIIQDNIKSNE